MAFGGFSEKSRHAPMADINMTPLIDVMLVLLVIFIITAPLMTHAIKLNLPAAASNIAPQKPQIITVSIDADGKVFWEKEPLELAALSARFAQLAQQANTKKDGSPNSEPEIHLRADQGTRYQVIAAVMSAAQQAGLAKIGFVTQPNTKSE